MKKKLIITFSVIAVVAIAGYFGYRFAVNYIFDEYVLKTALTALGNAEKNQPAEENKEDGKVEVQAILDGLSGKNADEYTEGDETDVSGKKKDEKSKSDKKSDKQDKTTASKKEDSKTEKKDDKKSTATTKETGGDKKTTSSGTSSSTTKKRLSDSEVLDRVMKDSSLAYKMASMVSYEDKQAVISMVKSNFTSKQIADMVASGMSRSEMISVARSSITGAQWSQCMAIARKYVDQIRPYVE